MFTISAFQDLSDKLCGPALQYHLHEIIFMVFRQWILSLIEPKGVIAVDGKTMRDSQDGHNSAIHMISAYSTEYGLCLGQEATKCKGHEIKGMLDLIDSLALKKCIVRIDAMATQTSIAKKIIDKRFVVDG